LSTNIGKFLKDYHSDLYREYVFERYRVNGTETPLIRDTPEVTQTSVETISEFELELVSEMDQTSPVAQYIKSRRLPNYPFYFSPKFKKFAAKYNPVFEDSEYDGPRLVIPFFDKSGKIFAFQGRDLTGQDDIKYITVTVNPKVPKIFGIDRVKKGEILIVEGPIDSLFLPNCVASVNASLVATATKLQKAINKEHLTIIYDNEPRNNVIVSAYSEAIKLGYKIVIWPKSVDGIKDINDMVIKGIDPLDIIKKRTFSGLMAQIEFQKWKKV
jgi:hypothetical protein